MKAPEAPDPKDTAKAQGEMNKETAIATYGLNATNQRTPWGSLTYSQIGTWPDGTPRYQATQTLKPKIQNVVDSSINRMNKPFSLSNEATESRLMELGRKRLDPLLDRRRISTEQDLYNRGVRGGTEAYRHAMEGVTQGENDAYNQLLLNGRSQAVSEALTERSVPMNEAIALMSGGQAGYINTPGSQVAPVDYTGLVNQKYQADVGNYQAGMSGMFGLGSALLGGWAKSDERLKTDIHKVGETDEGIPLKTFRYKGSPMLQLGVMAQDVEKKKPSAVRRAPDGYREVHYPSVVH